MNKCKIYQMIISIIIDEFNKELEINIYNETPIFKIFYGERETNNNKEKYFNTIFINLQDYIRNEKTINLEEIMNDNFFKNKEKIKVFPKVLIIIVLYIYEDYLQIPFELNLNNVEKKYNLKSAIKYEDDFTFIIPNKNNTLIKGYFNVDKIQYEIDINEKDINNCFVYFYERKSLFAINYI